MRRLASFVMRGIPQAGLAAVVWAILSLLLPPFAILSAAVIALVTLRDGLRRGLAVMLLAVVGVGLCALPLGVSPSAMMEAVLPGWLPVWLFAGWLRTSRSLSLTVTVALLLGIGLVLLLHLGLDDPQAVWRQILEQVAAAIGDPRISTLLVEVLAPWMIGVLGAGVFLQTVFALLLARWWQALLYNPGGFRGEFHALRLPRWVAGLAAVAIAIALLEPGPQAADHVVLVLFGGLFLQGLALAHGVLGRLGANSGWLVAIYGLLLLAMPYTASALAAAGFADVWFDYRARMGSGQGSGPAGQDG